MRSTRFCRDVCTRCRQCLCSYIPAHSKKVTPLFLFFVSILHHLLIYILIVCIRITHPSLHPPPPPCSVSASPAASFSFYPQRKYACCVCLVPLAVLDSVVKRTAACTIASSLCIGFFRFGSNSHPFFTLSLSLSIYLSSTHVDPSSP